AGEVRAFRYRLAGHRAAGKSGRGRWSGHERDVLAVSGARDRDGVRLTPACRVRHSHRDRRQGHYAGGDRRKEASLQKRILNTWPRTPAIQTIFSTTPSTTGCA